VEVVAQDLILRAILEAVAVMLVTQETLVEVVVVVAPL
jgi:hypothetical protein